MCVLSLPDISAVIQPKDENALLPISIDDDIGINTNTEYLKDSPNSDIFAATKFSSNSYNCR